MSHRLQAGSRWWPAALGAASCVVALALIQAQAASAVGEYEPNNSRSQAFGPLAGGTQYHATLESADDVDWYQFYVLRPTQLDVSGQVTSSITPEFCTPRIFVYNDAGQVLNETNIAFGQERHLPARAERAGRYFVKVQTRPAGCEGDTYFIRINPADALTASEQCGQAVVRQEDAERDVKKLKRKVARAEGERKEKLRRKLRRKKRIRNDAREDVAQLC
jgi:hypothetical protein